MSSEEDRKSFVKMMGAFSLIVGEVLFFPILGASIGRFLTMKWGFSMWYSVGLGVGGFIIAMIRLYRWVK